jgi:MFS family permease
LEPPQPRPLPAAHRIAPGAFYGWIVAGAISLVSFVVVGVGFYGLAVFLDALCTERGWSRSEVSFATTLYFMTSGIAGVAVGRSVDRHGPRIWIGVGAAVMALGLLFVGRVESARQLALVYPLLALGFAMTGAVPSGAIITRWFVARRARAMSISMTGVSIGGIVLVPFMTAMIARDGLAVATRVLALMVLAIVLPLVTLVLRSNPEAHGLLPDGGAVPPSTAHPAPLSTQQRHWTTAEALRTRTFWVLVAAFGGILFCQVGTAMHQLSLLRRHLDTGTAAFAVSTTAFGSVVARLVVGGFADRVSKRKLCVALMCLQAMALLGFSVSERLVPLYGCSLLFGVTIGNVYMLQSLLVGELFGMRSFGTVLGALQLITQTASGLGPFALGLLHAWFGGYPQGLSVLVAIALSSAAILSRVRAPEPAAALDARAA